MTGLGSLAIYCGAPLSHFSLMVLVLVAALPSASNVPMLAERFGADSRRTARVVLLTTVMAFICFSVAVSIVQRLDIVRTQSSAASISGKSQVGY